MQNNIIVEMKVKRVISHFFKYLVVVQGDS